MPVPPWMTHRLKEITKQPIDIKQSIPPITDRHTNHYFIDTKFRITEEIFSVNGRGLGDVWGSICYFYKLSEDFGTKLKLSKYYMKSQRRREFERKAAEIIPLIDSTGSMNFVDGDPTIKIRHQNIGYIPYFPTKIRWMDIPICGHPSESNSTTFCYQFDGKSHKGAKNMTKDHEKLIIDSLQSHGLSPIKLGGHLSLNECVNHLSKCKLFVGVDSGFAHVSCSVRSPTYIIRNQRPVKDLDDIYFGKGARFCNSALDFVENLDDSIIRTRQ